jgi:pyruvate, water dikinase
MEVQKVSANGKCIFRLEDLCQGDSGLVGKKCANLGELTRAGFQVPPGFALSVAAYDQFLKETGALDEIRRHFSTFDADPNNPKDMPRFSESSRIVRQIVESAAMPASLGNAIGDLYVELCRKTGIENVFVSTRSAGPVSHPGQYESYLFVRGRDEVLLNVKKVWASTFNTRSLVARARKDLPLEYDPIGVAVLRMVDARAAGVMFTAEPTTGEPWKVIIEGNWGVGESVVSGSVTPDHWVVDKRSGAIIERKISQKTIQHALDTATGKACSLEVKSDQQCEACLANEEIVSLAKLGERVEGHFSRPQDIEWAIDKERPANIFVLQTRDEKFHIELHLAGF